LAGQKAASIVWETFAVALQSDAPPSLRSIFDAFAGWNPAARPAEGAAKQISIGPSIAARDEVRRRFSFCRGGPLNESLNEQRHQSI
jgi:hypothetical protein